MRIEILSLVLSNDNEVSGDDFEGVVHGGRVGRSGCGKRQTVLGGVGWGGAGKRKRRREIVFF
ncbi:unnamed protein product [Prunus armeniaca]|uniref:Uncharacterized protein n=1 Tax=Prunus armeniaca TaxID=36596 RepID=A0A6J5US62_PRUAR|nr:unnamed protein product [Prunus armeniaca]